MTNIVVPSLAATGRNSPVLIAYQNFGEAAAPCR